jgi:hypothetical protein
MSTSELFFGVGCFHFGIKKKAPFTFLGLEYIEKLNNSLASIPSISNIKVSREDKDFEALSVNVNIDEDIPPLGESGNFFPSPAFLRISFEIFVPFRIQKEFFGVESRTFTEKFLIATDYTFFYPVSIISLLGPSEIPNPSDGVVVAREFLKNEFDKLDQDYIRFESLGPSPFHADFRLKPSKHKLEDGKRWRYRVEHLPKMFGYDEIHFTYNENIYKDITEALEEIYVEHSSEFGFFYSLMNDRSVGIHEWMKIDELLEKLISVHRMSGAKGFISRLFRCSGLIGDALTNIVDFQARRLLDTGENKRRYEEVYKYGKQPCIQSYVDEELKHAHNYPEEEYSELITFYEKRRSKRLEILIAFVSAIIGGSIGALLTLLLTKR